MNFAKLRELSIPVILGAVIGFAFASLDREPTLIFDHSSGLTDRIRHPMEEWGYLQVDPFRDVMD